MQKEALDGLLADIQMLDSCWMLLACCCWVCAVPQMVLDVALQSHHEAVTHNPCFVQCILKAKKTACGELSY